MSVFNVNLGEDQKINLILGQQGENAVTSVVFDFSAWSTAFGSGTLSLSVQRPGDALPYAVVMTVSGTDATWEITDLDTAYKGTGEIQLKYTVGTKVKKSVVHKFTVYRSLGENGEYPSPGQTWQEGIEDDIEGLRTDVDADHDELIDIREGADGVTYPSAGDAVRGQITDVKSDLQFNKSIFQPVGDNLISIYNKNRYDGKSEPGYLGTSGQIITHSEWVTTILIYVGDLTEIVASKKVISTGDRSRLPMYFLCTYDENGVFIEQIAGNPERYTIGDGVCYIRFSYHDQVHTDIQVESGTNRTEYVAYNYKALDDKIENEFLDMTEAFDERYSKTIIRIDNAISNTDYVDITDQLTLFDGYIDNTNGNLVSYSGAKATDFMNIYEYGDLFVTGSAPYAGNCLFAVYDENQLFLGYHKNGTETNYHFRWEDIINSYPTASFVRFASITANKPLAIKRPSTLGEIIAEFGTKEWAGKKWVCIGDSLTEANSRTTKHYYEYVSEKTGITTVINAGSGSGYKNPSSVDNKTFYERAAEIPTDADVVTIFGSGNDLTHGYTLGDVTDTGTTTICGCINTTLDALIARIPAIQLGIVAPTPWVSFPPSTAGNGMELYVEALKTICENRSIPFLDLYHCSNLRPWTAEGRTACYSKDDGNGVHPDENGHKLIAPRFNGFLETLLL